MQIGEILSHRDFPVRQIQILDIPKLMRISSGRRKKKMVKVKYVSTVDKQNAGVVSYIREEFITEKYKDPKPDWIV